MIYINYARNNNMKVSFAQHSNKSYHVRLGKIKSKYILKGDADLIIASDVYEVVRNIDYLKSDGRLRITERYKMIDERHMQYSKKKCYDYLRSLGLLN